jgi:hypothetical protein
MMIKKTVVLFLLTGLLTACQPAAPAAPSTATLLPIASVVPTKTTSITTSPLPDTTLATIPGTTLEADLTAIASTNLTLERVAQLGGIINGITITSDVAYVGMGPRLAAINISQHTNPQLLNQTEPLPGLVTQVLQISSRPALCLLVSAGKYLVEIVPSSSGELQVAFQLELPGAISAMVWDAPSGILYAGGSNNNALTSGFISSIGIIPDSYLNSIDTVVMPEVPQSLTLGSSSLFAGAQGYAGGLYYIQVKTPGELTSPLLVIPSTPEEPLQPLRMQVIGERLYLGYRDIEAYDITNPGQPALIWRKNLGGIVVKDFYVSGSQFFFFGWTIKSEYVRGAFTAPEPVAGTPLGDVTSVTAMHAGDFLVAFTDLEIYDAANLQDLQLMGSYLAPASDVLGAVANEKAVFVVDNGARNAGVGNSGSNAVLWVLNLPDLQPLSQVMTEFSTYWHPFHGIALEGDRVYIAAENGVWIYEVRNSRPALIEKANFIDRQIEAIVAINLADKRLLVTSQLTADLVNLLTVYDLTDLQRPVILGNSLTIGQGHTLQITWKEPDLFVLMDSSYFSDSDVLHIIRFNNSQLALRESLKLPDYMISMAVGTNLVAATHSLSL